MSKILTSMSAALTSAVFGLAGLGLASQAHADPWPGCETEKGPCHWCPGDEPVHTGNHITDPVVWDESICHTYWYVYPGQGNVANLIWDGDNPPPPPQAPPALISTYEQCQQMLGALSLFCPKA